MYKIGKTIFDIKLPKDFEKIARLERFKYDVIESDVSFELNFIDELPKIDESKCNYASQQLVIEKHEDFTRYFQSLGSSYAIVDEYKKIIKSICKIIVLILFHSLFQVFYV